MNLINIRNKKFNKFCIDGEIHGIIKLANNLYTYLTNEKCYYSLLEYFKSENSKENIFMLNFISIVFSLLISSRKFIKSK